MQPNLADSPLEPSARAVVVTISMARELVLLAALNDEIDERGYAEGARERDEDEHNAHYAHPRGSAANRRRCRPTEACLKSFAPCVCEAVTFSSFSS
jgi:hypothetical protein